MPVTPTIQNVKPTVGASADTWGGTINDRIGETYADIHALATLANATETKANDALPKAGGDLTGDLGLGDPTPDDAFSAGFRGLPTVSIDADRTFAAKDAGKCIRLTGTTARTWTIPPGVLGVGQVIVLRNAGTAALSISRGSGVELRLAGLATNANRSLAAQGYATLYQEATNIWLISGSGVS